MFTLEFHEKSDLSICSKLLTLLVLQAPNVTTDNLRYLLRILEGICVNRQYPDQQRPSHYITDDVFSNALTVLSDIVEDLDVVNKKICLDWIANVASQLSQPNLIWRRIENKSSSKL
jgi:hypothetical protein